MRGFTLIELVLAVTVLAVGVLALAGTTVPLGRLIRRGGVQAASAAAAGARIEVMRAAGCPAPEAGTATVGGIRLAWSLTSGGPLRTVTVVATYAWGPSLHSDTYRTAISCPR